MQVRRFTILPKIPARLKELQAIASNLLWTWMPDAIGLFRRLDDDLFTATMHNPVKMLGVIDQAKLDANCEDPGFLAYLDAVAEKYRQYLSAETWFSETFPDRKGMSIAYFSAEFGLHESLPIYSGGLGLLAGDHLKSASDLGLPLVGVSLCYQNGYFRQYLNADGWQQERYPENDFYTMACELQRDPQGQPITIFVEYPGRNVFAQIWKVSVGRISLYLLDANISQNSAEDRLITAQLYGGDQDMRIRQELLLGIGGLRALNALGIEPTVCHMNEGHSAFLGLERIATTMQRSKVDFDTAREMVQSGNVFTTHTPVEAGNDMFPTYLIDSYLEPIMRRLGIDRERLLGLGRQNPFDKGEPFCMTVLALRLADHANGVSKLHGKVSRRMWRNVWPDLPENDVPIRSITNGVHLPSYLGAEMSQLYDRYLGPQWREKPADHSIWQKIELIPDAEIWRTHERRRERLVAFCRDRVKQQLRARNAPPNEVAAADEVLDPDALTIGFARRFATYKRATLVLSDLVRLEKILNNSKRPVQIIFAGKAHPKDHGGKELIQYIVHAARNPELRRRLVFIEDYDINVARYLVQGVDVWLNNPRRPLEASGTSGMKGPVNGILNMSVLDGWWCEGYGIGKENGWAIGNGEEYSDLKYQDEIESKAIYDLLEKEVVPLYYNRGADGLPRDWIRWMKKSVATICPIFNTNRMVQEYTDRFYLPAATQSKQLSTNNLQYGAELARWLNHVRSHWNAVQVENVGTESGDSIHVGQELKVKSTLQLGALTPKDVRVELYHGSVDATGTIANPFTDSMNANGNASSDGKYQYEGLIRCKTSGQHGFAVRVIAQHPHLGRAFEPGLIKWG